MIGGPVHLFFALVFAVSIGLMLLGLYSKKHPMVIYGLIALVLALILLKITCSKEPETPVILPAQRVK
ncbi:MAG: hypothetical protein JWP91_854 [Fibrobacteres bacterium]|nr:hypothetical protein [Fibrobacterota bacterium]